MTEVSNQNQTNSTILALATTKQLVDLIYTNQRRIEKIEEDEMKKNS